MPSAIADGVHMAQTFARAGMLRPSRPDRTFRALVGLHRFGPTLAAGYLGNAARHPDRAAIIDELGTLTFAEIDRAANAIARGFAGYGVRPGDGVAVICRNHRWFVAASLACSKLGAHALYLNTSFAAPQVTEVCEREKPRAIVFDSEFAEVIAEAGRTRAVFVAWSEGGAPSGELPSLAELAATRSGDPLPAPADPGRAVILTSGTTGTPKGANRPTPGSMGPAAALLSTIPLHAREQTLIAAPLFHAWGFAHMFLSTALSSTLILQRRFDPEATLRSVAEHRAEALIVVPVMLQRMLELPAEHLEAIDTSSLRVIAVSGSALPGPLATRAMDAFGDVLYTLSGSTEVAWASVAGPEDLRAAPGTAGRPPRGTVVRILSERGEELAAGERGRIFVGSELLFEGYTGGGDKDRIGGLMSTGDMGHFDVDRRLFVDGRDDDMIISGGENVFPAEIEDVLAGAAGVAEAAVVGVADEDFGQRLCAYIVPAAGAVPDGEALKALVRDRLARYKVPREIVFVSELPRTATGKVLKRELAAPASVNP